MQLRSHGDMDNVPRLFMKISCSDSAEDRGGPTGQNYQMESSSQERKKTDFVLHGSLFVACKYLQLLS